MASYDAVSFSSHFATAVWAAFATLVLLRLTRGHGVGRWAVGFFGFTMVLLYSSSALFHGWRYATFEERLLLQKLDKSAVFLLIAGSYVPVAVYLLGGRMRRFILGTILGLTAFGVGSLWLAPDLPHETLVGVYALLALSGLTPIRHYAAVAGWDKAWWAGVIVGPFLAGAVVEVLQTPVLIPGWFGPHELMHVAVTLGSLVYFSFLVKVLIRRPPVADVLPGPEWAPAEPELTRSGFAPAVS